MANRFFRKIDPEGNPSDPGKDYGIGGFAVREYQRRMRRLAEGNAADTSTTSPDRNII